MPLRRILFGAVALAVLLYLAFRPPEAVLEEPQFVQRQFSALGTWFTVSVWLDEPEEREAALDSIDAVQRGLEAFNRRWSPTADGALARINAELAAGGMATIAEPLRPLLTAAEHWRRISGGAFDARIGRLVALWGFDAEEHFRDSPPPAEAVDAAVQALAEAPDYDGGARYGPAGVAWNLGAIAKGDAVQRASDRLSSDGFGNHIVNAGGDLVSRGRRGDRAWRVAIRHPRGGLAQQLLAAVETGDEAVYTSGDYERFFEHEGSRYHHILNPASGRPARGLQSVTVIHPDARTADAASTALFVAGEGWRGMAERLEINTAMVVYADGSLGMTEDAEARLRLIGEQRIRETSGAWPAESPVGSAQAPKPTPADA